MTLSMETGDQNQKAAALKKVRVNENSDRISSLHDSILHLIMSFLPLEDAVKTSLLSKRWQKLWISLPYLHFEAFYSHVGDKLWFINFADKFMHYRDHGKSGIIKLRLFCPYTCDQPHIFSWICAAVTAGVQDLQLCTRLVGVRLPSCLFNCNSMVSLKLNACHRIQMNEPFCFPRLKKMHLEHATLANSFTSCLLKSPSLQELILIHCSLDQDSSSPGSHQDGTFINLNKAVIRLKYPRGKKYEENRRISCLFLRSLIQRLSRVEHLELRILPLQTGGDLLEDLPTFCNLKKLYLIFGKEQEADEVRGMACLLSRSQNLQYLGLRYFSDEHRQLMLQLPSFVDCLPRSLKRMTTVNLLGIKEKTDRHELVRLFRCDEYRLTLAGYSLCNCSMGSYNYIELERSHQQ